MFRFLKLKLRFKIEELRGNQADLFHLKFTITKPKYLFFLQKKNSQIKFPRGKKLQFSIPFTLTFAQNKIS